MAFSTVVDPDCTGKWTCSHGLRRGINRIHNIFSEVSGVRGHEPHTANAGNICHFDQQIGKPQLSRSRIDIRIHRLPEKLDLAVSHIRQLMHLFQYRRAGAAAFRSTGKWNNTVRTSLVATFNDCQIRSRRLSLRVISVSNVSVAS